MTENSEPNVGMRIRELREQRNLSLRAVAKRCGLSINAISQIERGENSPTVSSLHRLATALNTPITDFFHKETRQRTVFVKQDLGLSYQSDGVMMESLGIGLSNQQLEPFRLKIEPRFGNIDDPISHSGEEFVHCLEGEIEYYIDDRVYRLKAGDSLLFDATQLHSYRNPTQNPVIFLLVFQAEQEHHPAWQIHLDQ